MNPSNPSYLFDGRQHLSNLLIKLISGSMDIFDRDQSLNNSINNLTSQLFRDTNPERYKIFLENKFDEMIVYIMDISRRKGNIKLLMSVLDLLITITNNSEDFVVALMKTNLVELLINDTICFAGSRNRQELTNIIDLYLITIFNIIRHYKCRQYFRQHLKIEKFKELILPFVRIDFQNMKIHTYLILTFLKKSDDKDMNVILQHSDTIGSIHEYICNALKSEDKTYLGFDVWELLVGLKALSEIDPIRIKMVKLKGFVATIIAIVSSKNSKSKEVSVALEIFQGLCFNENIRKCLIEQCQLDIVIERLTLSSDDSIKRNAETLLVKLRPLVERNLDNESVEYDVFVSYADMDRDIICKAVDALDKKLKVYINLKSQALIDFKTIINKSKVVIIGVSNSYQETKRCLSEAVHARLKRKLIIPLILIHKLKLSSELKEIIGSEKSIDFSNYSTFIESMNELNKKFQGNYVTVNNIRKVTNAESLKSQLLGTTKLYQLDLVKAAESKDYSIISSMITMKLDKIDYEKDNTTTTNKFDFSKFPNTPELIQKTEQKQLNKESNFESMKATVLGSGESPQDNCDKWNKNQVSQWLTSNNLVEIHNKFVDFDGPMLKSIKRMKRATPKMYYKHLEATLELSFVEILRLDSALEKLAD